jgi:hypothetical protein
MIMPQDRSIWFEQVCDSLVTFVKDCLDFGGKSVKVVVRKPEDEFRTSDFPLVTIYPLFSRFESIRYDPEPAIVSRNMETKKVVVEKSAIPYKLHFQIDFFTAYQTDMDYLVKTWKYFTPNFFVLPVTDPSGGKHFCCVHSLNDMNRTDMLSEGKRIYRTYETYKTSVELDFEKTLEIPMYMGDNIVEIRNMEDFNHEG